MGAPRARRFATHTAAFIAGVVTAIAVVGEAREDDNRYRTLDAFAQSLSLIRRNHVDLVSERKLVYGAIEGMLAKLDRHSSFYPPRRYQRLREDTQGEFGGVGLVLRRAKESSDPPYPVVDDVIEGSPAHRAGIAVGLELISIDGEPTAEKGQTKRRGRAFHSLLRGPIKSKIALEFRKGSRNRKVSLDREKVKVPSIESWTFGASVGYVRIRRFQDATRSDLEKALAALGGKALKGLILDLRNNPGGLFDQAVFVADLFLSKGIIVQVTGRNDLVLERPEARSGSPYERLPIAVLVDGNTASAAEILAGALKDHGRAELFGKKTFGKGSVQTFYDLPDGAGLKLTTARYVSPLGTVIHGTGIAPNHDIEEFAGETFVVGAGADDDPGAALRRKWPHLTSQLAERLDADFQLHEAYSSMVAPAGGAGK